MASFVEISSGNHVNYFYLLKCIETSAVSKSFETPSFNRFDNLKMDQKKEDGNRKKNTQTEFCSQIKLVEGPKKPFFFSK